MKHQLFHILTRLLPLLCGAGFLLSLSCGPAHLAKVTPKQRRYEEAELGRPERDAPATGSLWNEQRGAASLFTDVRAFRQGDILMVRVQERANAKRDSDTTLAREGKGELAISQFLGLLSQLPAGITPSIGGSANTSFKGGGSTSRSEDLVATVPATVRKVLPTGNLFIEGHRAILVNDEEQHFYISGVVRPIDIEQDNSVQSERIADAEIEFTGRGVVTDTQRQGWLSRFIGWIWPF